MKPIAANVADIAGSKVSLPRSVQLFRADQGNSAMHTVSANQSTAVDSAVLSGGGAHDNQQKIEEAVDKMNKEIQRVSREIQFSVDKSTDKVVIKVIDQQTKEVIRQIPSEEVLSLAEHLGKLEGMLLNEKA